MMSTRLRAAHAALHAVLRTGAVTLALLHAAAAPAQGQRQAMRPAIVALTDSLPVTDARAVVLYDATSTRGSVILLPSGDPAPELLGAALVALDRIERAPHRPGASALVPIAGALPPRALRGAVRAALRGVLADVARQPRARIATLGAGRWLSIDRDAIPLR